jgi:hypothetical protein
MVPEQTTRDAACARKSQGKRSNRAGKREAGKKKQQEKGRTGDAARSDKTSCLNGLRPLFLSFSVFFSPATARNRGVGACGFSGKMVIVFMEPLSFPILYLTG